MSLAKLGYLPVDLTNFPGKVSSVLFTKGCPLRCPYCHNPSLVVGPTPENFLARLEILSRLKSRQSLISGVVVTGGEPLMHRDLSDLIDEISSLDVSIKLDTCGYYPKSLERILEKQSIQWVSLDVKTFPEQYELVGSINGGRNMLQSLEILKAWKQKNPERVVQLRTTFAPKILEKDEFLRLQEVIHFPQALWTGTQYTPGNCLDSRWNAEFAFTQN